MFLWPRIELTVSIGTSLDCNIVVAGLLSVDFYPLVVIEVSHDIFLSDCAYLKSSIPWRCRTGTYPSRVPAWRSSAFRPSAFFRMTLDFIPASTISATYCLILCHKEPDFRWSRIGNAIQVSIGVFMAFRGVYTPIKKSFNCLYLSNHLPRSSVFQESSTFVE